MDPEQLPLCLPGTRLHWGDSREAEGISDFLSTSVTCKQQEAEGTSSFLGTAGPLGTREAEAMGSPLEIPPPPITAGPGAQPGPSLSLIALADRGQPSRSLSPLLPALGIEPWAEP